MTLEINLHLIVDPIILSDFLHSGTPPISENPRREGDLGCGDSEPLSHSVVSSSSSLYSRPTSLRNNIFGVVAREVSE